MDMGHRRANLALFVNLALATLLPALGSAQKALFDNCGGQGWSTTCVAGATCVFSNPFYAQCLPDRAAAIASTTQPAPPPASTTTSHSSADDASTHTSPSPPAPPSTLTTTSTFADPTVSKSSTQPESSTTTTQSSSASIGSPPPRSSAPFGTSTVTSSGPAGLPTGGQSNLPSVGGASSKSSMSAGKIAAMVVGIIALMLLLIALFVWTRRRYMKIRAVLAPVFRFDPAAQHPILPITVSEKDRVVGTRPRRTAEPGTFWEISSQAAQIRQEYLINRIREAQREIHTLDDNSSPPYSEAELRLGNKADGALDEANQRNEALQKRIRVLETQLRSQWALGLSDEPPPGYLE
ncbi:hypothetical protein FB451DRAFT_707535 [Mycena latifolia]|nr:hypothetical protein FB451DRAFT_707535 [Mycena latifolia]